MIKLLLFLLSFIPLTDIGKINAAKSAAKKAFLNNDYKTAADQYQYLVDSLGVREEEVLLNLAHARFQLNDTTQALQGYRQLASSVNSNIRSSALQQLGVMSSRGGQLDQALEQFKLALKANPNNEQARFNYELVRRKLAEQEKQNQEQKKDQNKKDDQKKQDQQNQKNQQKDKQNQEQKKDQQQKQQQNKSSDEKKNQEQKQEEQQNQEQKQNEKEKQNQLDPEKMKNMKVSEEKAKMILEAMKSNEVQYLQQNKRRATKPKDKNKPDW